MIDLGTHLNITSETCNSLFTRCYELFIINSGVVSTLWTFLRNRCPMKTYDFRVTVNNVTKTYRICAESYTIASNIIKTKFPVSAIISPAT